MMEMLSASTWNLGRNKSEFVAADVKVIVAFQEMKPVMPRTEWINPSGPCQELVTLD